MLSATLFSCSPSIMVTLTRPAEVNLKNYKKVSISEFQNPNWSGSITSLNFGNAGSEFLEMFNSRLASNPKFELVDKITINRAGTDLSTTFFLQGNVTACKFVDNGVSAGSTSVKDGKSYTSYTRSGRLQFVTTLRLIDASTGKILSSKTVDASQDYSKIAINKHPYAISVDGAYAEKKAFIFGELMKIIFPYDVRQYVAFDSDKSFKEDLKLCVNEFRAGKVEVAIQMLKGISERTDLPSNEAKAKALYNYGKMLVYTGAPNEAITLLEKAVTMSNGKSSYTRMLNEAKTEAELLRKLQEQN